MSNVSDLLADTCIPIFHRAEYAIESSCIADAGEEIVRNWRAGIRSTVSCRAKLSRLGRAAGRSAVSTRCGER